MQFGPMRSVLTETCSLTNMKDYMLFILILLIQVRNRKVLGWEEIYKPEVCEAKANWDDQLHMHYEATRFSSY